MPKERIIYNLFNKSRNYSVASSVKAADNFLLRLKGLMFRKNMLEEEGLMFYHTSSIHTFFMRFPLDIVFIDKKMQVIKVYEALKPGKIAFCFSAYLAVELPPHKVSQKGLETGDILELIASSP